MRKLLLIAIAIWGANSVTQGYRQEPESDASLKYVLPQERTMRLLRQTAQIREMRSGSPIQAIRVNSSLEIDGHLKEQAWKESSGVGSFLTVYDAVPAPLKTEVQACWDDHNLYIGVRCLIDPQNPPKRGEKVWIQIAPEDIGKQFLQVAISYQGEVKVLEKIDLPGIGSGIMRNWMNRSEVVPVEWKAKVIREDKEWRIESVLPLDQLPFEKPDVGSKWRFNVVRDRSGTQPISSWFPLRRPYNEWGMTSAKIHVENRYGEILFVEQPKVTLAERPLGRVYYIGPHRLKWRLPISSLSDAVQWEWEDPRGNRTTLEDVEMRQHETEWEVVFNHPSVLLNGRYSVKATSSADKKSAAALAHITFDREAWLRAGAGAQKDVLQQALATRPRRHVPLRLPTGDAASFLAMMPVHTGFRGCYSPAIPSEKRVGRGDSFDWDPTRPDQLICRQTGHIFPDEERFPTAGSVTYTNLLGEKMEYPYVMSADGKRCFIEPHLWFRKSMYILNHIEHLAEKDPSGAAQVLYELAKRYPGYAVKYDIITWGDPHIIEGSGGPYRPAAGGVWSAWPNSSETRNVAKMARAFQTVRETDILDQLRETIGEDVEKRIEYGMIRPSIEQMRGFDLRNHNTDAYMWQGMVETGIALNDPDYFHDALERCRQFLEREFYLDGFYAEVTLSYHNQIVSNIVSRLARITQGWTDPEGYLSSRSRRRIENFDMRRDFIHKLATAHRAVEVLRSLATPQGTALPVQDTWANMKISKPYISNSILLPAAKIARLASGDGEMQTQAYLLFQPKYASHRHHDALGLVFYAEGEELIPDLGYNRSHLRSWSASSLAHNMVVVDGKEVAHRDVEKGGNIEIFVPEKEGVQVIRASETNAYPGVTQVYERELWLISTPDRPDYLIDVFRVEGGDRHEYTLNGDPSNEAAFETNLPLTPYNSYLLPPGTPVQFPRKMSERGKAGDHNPAYMFVQNVSQAAVTDKRYEITLRTQEADLYVNDGKLEVQRTGKPSAGFRLTGFALPGNSQLFLGHAPSFRPARLSRETREVAGGEELWKHWMPKMVLRREGSNLKSTFVSVIEPYAAGSFPENTIVEKIDETPEGIVGLSIRHGDYEDIILTSHDVPNEPIHFGAVTFRGRLGLVRLKNGNPVQFFLVGGTELRYADNGVVSKGSVEGKLLGVRRTAAGDEVDGLLCDRKIDPMLKGCYLIVTHPDGEKRGYAIKDIRDEGEGSLVELECDPGFEIADDGTSSLSFYPHTFWSSGVHSFQIEHVVSAEAYGY